MRIVDFEPRHAEAWKSLNEAWISRHFAIEPSDREVLDDPVGKVIGIGGLVLMAEDADGARSAASASSPFRRGRAAGWRSSR